ncbi:MAG: DNA polymerase IV [Candidatus Lokiarchaeota archaeon]|nr:DNA polymerase IV [Candidatus Lokiarchaeota archaeon]MBD3342390.1 DNA polymerase IV [Candidatus Lokiarchaeota archaeon]
MNRIIFHCDLDCFFASVETRDEPDYRGKPVIIGADPKRGNGRGVVSTCNYEARRYGLHSAMPISQAFARCPQGIYLKPNRKKYTEASKQVMEILEGYSEDFQKVGVDEAYLELTDTVENYDEAQKTAKRIQKEIYEKVGITISIGIAPTKSLAKIASDEKKPNGITVVKESGIVDFLTEMELTRIPGIGRKSKVYYNKKGFFKIGDIINTPLPKFKALFGRNGIWIWKIAHGIDKRKVRDFHKGRKSVSAERTFHQNTKDFSEILSKLEEINEKIHKIVGKHHISYRTITLKIRLAGYETYTRSKSYDFPFQNKHIVLKTVLELYKEFENNRKKIRLLGIRLSNFNWNLKVKQTSILNYASI